MRCILPVIVGVCAMALWLIYTALCIAFILSPVILLVWLVRG